MGEGLRQRFHGVPLVTRDEDNDELFDSDSFSSDSEDNETAEDRARYSPGNSSPPASESTSVAPRLLSSNSPLCELSSLMEQLPIKRGLSKYYHGKSQSFTSLAEVSCVEDLPKKEVPFKRRTTIKPCKSYAGGLDGSQMKPDAAGGPCSRTTSKRTPPRVSSCAALVSNGGSRPPSFPAHKNLCLH